MNAVDKTGFKRSTSLKELVMMAILEDNTMIAMIKYHCVKSILMRSFFWSVFSCLWTEYGDLLCKPPYLFQIRENTDQKNSPYSDIFCAVCGLLYFVCP